MDAVTALTFGRLFKTSYGGDAIDFIDQLNYQFSSGVLVMLITILGVRHYVGKPIQCWVPAEYSKAWEEYAENICWISNTYFLLPHESIPDNEIVLRKVSYVSYYQWVVIVMAAQAMLLWIPHLIWRVGAKRLPILFQCAREASTPDRELRHKAVLSIVGALEEISEAHFRYRRAGGIFRRLLYGIHPAMRYTVLFFIVRMAFMANSLVQIYFMRRFLGQQSLYFGVNILENIVEGDDWNLSGNFPRVTYCTFKVRKMGRFRYSNYTLQCVLPVNHFIEKIYIFLWFWFACLTCLTALNTLQWMFHLLIPQRRVHFIKQYLSAMRNFTSIDERDCSRFVKNHLGWDGVFILRVVAKISSELLALDVTVTLWNNYRAAKLAGTEDDAARLLSTLHRSTTATV